MDILTTLLEQEKRLTFKEFNSKIAFEVGSIIRNKAIKNKMDIVIDITVNGHQLYHFAFDGTNLDHDDWIKRKRNIVNRFQHSSLYIGQKCLIDGVTFYEKFSLSEKQYAPYGGGFPIIVDNVGVIGCICVSGLRQKEDHQLIVDVLSEYLGKQIEN